MNKINLFMASSPIEGKNWIREVSNRSFDKTAIRKEFYQKRAALKLEADPEVILKNPARHGLKTFAELSTGKSFRCIVKKGDTLYKYLDDYFKGNGVSDPKTRKREVFLSLYFLTMQQDAKGKPINVDYLNTNWKVNIQAGKLSIYDAQHRLVVDSAYLRKPSEVPEGGVKTAPPPKSDSATVPEGGSRTAVPSRPSAP